MGEFKGVYWSSERNKYYAEIVVNGKKHKLGYSYNPEILSYIYYTAKRMRDCGLFNEWKLSYDVVRQNNLRANSGRRNETFVEGSPLVKWIKETMGKKCFECEYMTIETTPTKEVWWCEYGIEKLGHPLAHPVELNGKCHRWWSGEYGL